MRIRIAAAVAGIALGCFLDGFSWQIGTLFGVLVVLWCGRSPKALAEPAGLVFVAASTVIYGFVLWLAGTGVFHPAAWQQYRPLSSVIVAVFSGTLLLAAAHAALLGLRWRRAAMLVPGVFGVWLLHMIALDPRIVRLEQWSLIAIWQVLYLFFTAGAIANAGSRTSSAPARSRAALHEVAMRPPTVPHERLYCAVVANPWLTQRHRIRDDGVNADTGENDREHGEYPNHEQPEPRVG